MKSLSIAVATQIVSPTISENLQPVLEARGHSVTTYDISSLFLDNFIDNPILAKLAQHDLVYYRTGLAPEVAICLERYLKSHNVACVNLNFATHPFIAAKTYQILQAGMANILIPKTLHDRTSSFEEIAAKIGSPFIAKANRSSQGLHVHLIKDQGDLDKITPNLKVLEYFFQEYIPHESEYRVHVVGKATPAMYQRIPVAGDFRSNVSRGGSMVPVEAKHQEILSAEALKVAALFDFSIIAVDFMKHTESGAFYFTEKNLNPGWETSDEEVTGVDLSEIVADYFEKRCL